jgi:hypothetical protein
MRALIIGRGLPIQCLFARTYGDKMVYALAAIKLC